MTALFGHSKDPLFVKKIALRIWRLQDEIESIVVQKIKNDPEIAKNAVIDELTKEYSNNVVALHPQEDDGEAAMAAAIEDDGEAAMAAAIAGGDDADADEDGEAAMAAAIAEAEGGGNTPAEGGQEAIVKQRRPILPEDKIAWGKTIIKEINMEEMFFFCTDKFVLGSAIVVEFLVPKMFSVNGVLTHIREVNMKTRVLSEKKMLYRCSIKFTFLKEGERSLLREFLQSVEPDMPKASAKKEDDKGADEETDELEDLGL